MSRAVSSSDYYRINHTKAALPVKSLLWPSEGQKPLAFQVRWLPPESLSFGTFSAESDVWSLGVTVWEVLSFGMLPYGHLSNAQVRLRGARLDLVF